MDSSSLRTSFGVSVSFSASSSAASLADAADPDPPAPDAPSVFPPAACGLAPYPASSTALITCSSVAVPSTAIELVSRETLTDFTPGTFATAFSTWAWQDAHVMPVTM